jgi:tetratricopeptide (TPR) repeat protein
MAKKRTPREEMRTIVIVDAVNFTHELKSHGKSVVDPKIRQLLEFVEFFFVFKLKGEIIGKMGDGFLVLCPPKPIEVINEAIACQGFVAAYNHGKRSPHTLNVRIAIHYGLIAPPEGGNYVDTNLNLASRLEGVTPPNAICVSSVLHGIVSDTLRSHEFEKSKSNLKGLGQHEYYILKSFPRKAAEPTRREARLGFYFSVLDALREAENWESVRDTCEQALADFPDHPEFTSQLAFSYLILSEPLHSIRYYEQCVEMGYEIGDSLYFMGCSHRQLGNISRALEILEEAIENDPNLFHAMLELAEIYLDRKEYAKALEWAKKASKLAPRYPDPRAVQLAIQLIHGDKGIDEIVKKLPLDIRGRPDFESKVEDYLAGHKAPVNIKKLKLALPPARTELSKRS